MNANTTKHVVVGGKSFSKDIKGFKCVSEVEDILKSHDFDLNHIMNKLVANDFIVVNPYRRATDPNTGRVLTGMDSYARHKVEEFMLTLTPISAVRSRVNLYVLAGNARYKVTIGDKELPFIDAGAHDNTRLQDKKPKVHNGNRIGGFTYESFDDSLSALERFVSTEDIPGSDKLLGFKLAN